MNIKDLASNISDIKTHIDKKTIWYRWNNQTYHIELCIIELIRYEKDDLYVLLKRPVTGDETIGVNFSDSWDNQLIYDTPEELLNNLSDYDGKNSSELNHETIQFNLKLYKNMYPECFV